MPGRTYRGMYNRTVHAPDSKCLAVVPVYTREVLHSITGSIDCASLPTIGDTLESADIVGPIGFLEWNIYGLYVPWHLMTVYMNSLDDGAGTQGQVDDAVWAGLVSGPNEGLRDGAGVWDNLWRRLVYQWGAVTPQLYGGNLAATGPTAPFTAVDYDPIRRSWVRRSGAINAAGGGYAATVPEGQGVAGADDIIPKPGEIEGQTVQSEAIAPMAQDELIGPPGIVRVFSYESVLVANNVAGYSRGVTGFAGVLANLFGEGTLTVNDVVFRDRVPLDIQAPVPGPGAVIIGITRYNMPVSEEWDFTLQGAETGESQEAKAYRQDRNTAILSLIEASRDFVQTQISVGAGNVSEVIKTLLFGGDYYTEGTDDNEFASQLFSLGGGSYWRKNDIEAVAKLQMHYDTPYMMKGVT